MGKIIQKMNLMESQFDRLIKNPDDETLVKLVTVNFSGSLFSYNSESIRNLRVIAAKAFNKTEHPSLKIVLKTLLEVAAIAENYTKDKEERESVDKVLKLPINAEILKALMGKELSKSEITYQLNRTDEEVEEALWELAQLGVVRLNMNSYFRLTLQGLSHVSS